MSSVIKRVLLALLFVLSVPVAALADGQSQLVNSGGSTYANFPGGSTAGIVVKAVGSSRLYKIVNASTTAQTATFTCYDANFAGTGGVILWSGVLGASQIVDIEIQATTGIYCVPSAALNASTATSGGINVLAN